MAEDLLDFVCQIASDLANGEMAEIGSVTGRGFQAWTTSVDESVEIIRAKSHVLDRIEWGFTAWLSILPKGAQAGERYLAGDSEYAYLWQNE